MTLQKEPQLGLGIKLEETPDQGLQVVVEATDALEKLFGAKSPQMNEALLRRCFRVVQKVETDIDAPATDERFFLVGAVSEIKPGDGVERMLAVQMATTHLAMVRAGQWLANSDQLEQSKAHINGFTKLARAYTAQMEALRKHRNGGKQTVTVQHVTVEDGGQAVVGNVGAGGGAV
jgi:hypothetical protein